MCCSRFERVFFCSREQQKLIWPTHRWTCGKEYEPFSFPPLTDEELFHLHGTQFEFYQPNPMLKTQSTILEFLVEKGFFKGGWPLAYSRANKLLDETRLPEMVKIKVKAYMTMEQAGLNTHKMFPDDPGDKGRMPRTYFTG
ncbi:hypothetical protein JCM8547_002189 [Rhodosporidiobolus lusitaniae]